MLLKTAHILRTQHISITPSYSLCPASFRKMGFKNIQVLHAMNLLVHSEQLTIIHFFYAPHRLNPLSLHTTSIDLSLTSSFFTITISLYMPSLSFSSSLSNAYNPLYPSFFFFSLLTTHIDLSSFSLLQSLPLCTVFFSLLQHQFFLQ